MPLTVAAALIAFHQAFGKLGIKPSQSWLERWQQVAVAKIGEFNAQELANSLHAFRGLQCQPSHAFWKAWQGATVRQRELNDNDLRHLRTAVDHLRLNCSPELSRVLQHRRRDATTSSSHRPPR